MSAKGETMESRIKKDKPCFDCIWETVNPHIIMVISASKLTSYVTHNQET